MGRHKKNGDDGKELTCPKCKNKGRDNVSAVLPESLVVCLALCGKEGDAAHDLTTNKLSGFIRHKCLVPAFLECKQCGQYFKLNKNGKEFIPRISKLSCPKCHFDKPGRMNVRNRDHRTPLAFGSKGWNKTKYYNDVLFATEFECPICKTKFFVDDDGYEE